MLFEVIKPQIIMPTCDRVLAAGLAVRIVHENEGVNIGAEHIQQQHT